MSKFSARDIKGVIPPVMTAFDKEGNIYEKGIREIVRYLLPQVDGLFICGTYGAGPLSTLDQRKRVADIILEETNDQIPVIVHVGRPETKGAVELAKHAEKMGAPAVASVSPFYYSYSEEEMYAYFKSLIDAVSIPFFAYNNPKSSGNTITPCLLRRLADNGLAGLKDSSFDILNFYAFMDAVEGMDFNLIVGTEALILPAVAVGAEGCIAGVANVFPREVKEFFTACVENRPADEVWKLQQRTLEIRKTIKMGQTMSICCKILHMLGVDAGYPPAPLLPINAELKEKVVKNLKNLNLL